MSPNSATTRVWSLIAAVTLATAGLAGCLTQDASASSGEVYVKDALTDEASAVHVEFTRAEVIPADGGPPETVYEGRESIELLSLSDSAAKEKLADFEIEPGEYDRLRISISNVTVEHENGTQQDLVVYGNMVTVAENLSYEPGEDLAVLLDFDLETGVNLTRGEYTPVVGDVQRSDEDADEDGVPDINETDDDGDGIPDAQDEDRDGDGQPEMPKQAQAYDKRGLKGLCTAWENNEQGRENGTVESNATAFDWLQKQASEDGKSVDAYCEDQTAPGAPDDFAAISAEELPEKAREAIGDRHIGPPEDRGRDAAQDRSGDREQGSQADGRRDGEQRDEADRADGNDTRDQQDANRTEQRDDGNQTADDEQTEQRDGGNETADDGGNRTADDQNSSEQP